MKALLLVILFAGAMAVAADKASEHPDTIFVNGDFLVTACPVEPVNISLCGISVNGPKGNPRSVIFHNRTSALAVIRDRVFKFGPDKYIRALAGPKTKIVDLGGAFAMPGFNDAHIHLWSGGLEMQHVDLTSATSLEDMKARIATKAKQTPAGAWMQGRGWDHTKWQNQTLPTRQDVDSITGDHPAFFPRIDGHIGVANSAALKFAGIDRNTPDPQGGKIDRDASGEPTGILRETAKEALQAKIPEPTIEQRRQAVQDALAEAARFGLTSIQEPPVNPQDGSEWKYFLIYEELENQGKLTARITEWLPFPAPVNVLTAHRAHHPTNDLMLHTGVLKGYLDGSLGSRTAALLAPYADDPKNRGIHYYKQDQLNQMVIDRVRAGFGITFHAIGDRAFEMALNAFEAAANDMKQRHTPMEKLPDFHSFRVEHAQVTNPELLKRAAKLELIMSMQPSHLLTDMNWAEQRLGPGRAKNSYAWKSALENKLPLAFGTDYPVEPLTPFRGIYAAITRKNEAGTKEYYPQEKLTIDEAIAAYTSGAAFADFSDHDKGTLAPGMLADFVVLDRDITKVTPEEILKIKVLRTVVGGKTVYEAK
jgi:predicted amidohydrolase YtcJ